MRLSHQFCKNIFFFFKLHHVYRNKFWGKSFSRKKFILKIIHLEFHCFIFVILIFVFTPVANKLRQTLHNISLRHLLFDWWEKRVIICAYHSCLPECCMALVVCWTVTHHHTICLTVCAFEHIFCNVLLYRIVSLSSTCIYRAVVYNVAAIGW